MRRGLHKGSAWRGKEAIAVGVALDLLPEDTVVSSSDAAMVSFLKGMSLSSILGKSHQRPLRDVARKLRSSDAESAQSALATGIAFAQTLKIPAISLSHSFPKIPTPVHPDVRLFVCGDAQIANHLCLQRKTKRADQTVLVWFPGHSCGRQRCCSGIPRRVRMRNKRETRRWRQRDCVQFRSREWELTKSQDPHQHGKISLTSKGLFTDERRQSTVRTFEKEIVKAKSVAEERSHNPEIERRIATRLRCVELWLNLSAILAQRRHRIEYNLPFKSLAGFLTCIQEQDRRLSWLLRSSSLEVTPLHLIVLRNIRVAKRG